MAVLKVYTLFLLYLIVNVSNARPHRRSPPEKTYRLPETSVPVHYHVKLIPYIVEGNFSLDGECVVECAIVQPTPDVVLHARDLTIHESDTTLTRKEDATTHVPSEHIYDKSTDMLTIHFTDDLLPGSYILHLKYTGTLGTNLYGFYRSSYINQDGVTVWLAATHFQPTSARLAFPCWDEPALKATFKISIKHDSNYTALSNMPAEEHSEVDEDGKLWTHFQTTPVMSTNILAFVVADYDHISNENDTIRVWCRKDRLSDVKYLLEAVERATEVLEEYMNSTVRVPKMDHVAIPTYSSAATENWGLVTYLERYILHDDSDSFLKQKEAAMLTGVHEMAHMWFGNLISPSWWTYLWLSEGFATYFKYYIANKMYKDWRMDDRFVVSIYDTAINVDSYYSYSLNQDAYTTMDIRRKYGGVTYSKGASILRMLTHCISEEVFRAGVIKYAQQWQYSAVSPDDLWDAMQDAVNEANVTELSLDVKTVLRTWTDQSGFPIVNVTRNYTTGEIILTQELYTAKDEFIGHMENSQKWWIPLNFATQSDPDFSSTLPMLWFDPDHDTTLIREISSDDWIIVNIQQTGFYRVNYDTENWRKIARYLNSYNYTKIHVTNRAQIISDAFNSMMDGFISRRSFMEIINYLEREVDFVPWQPVFNKLIRYMEEYFDGRSSPTLKSYALNLMRSVIEAVGFEERSDDEYLTKQLRPEVIELACKLGHTDCRSNATAKLIAHLTDPTKHKLTPEMKRWTFCSGLQAANESVWMQVLTLYENKRSTEILRYLGCTGDPLIAERYFNMLMSDNSPILEDDRKLALDYAYWENPINVNAAASFAVNNIANSSIISETLIITGPLTYRATSINPDLYEKIKSSEISHIINAEKLRKYEETIAALEEDIFHVTKWAQNTDLDNADEIIFIENNTIDEASSE